MLINADNMRTYSFFVFNSKKYGQEQSSDFILFFPKLLRAHHNQMCQSNEKYDS